MAVWVSLTRGTRIEHNVIRHHPYTGVSLGWSWSADRTSAENNVVASNHIHGVMQILSDGGGIYTLGNQPGSTLRGNLIHDVPRNLGNAESNGIFMDEGSTGITVQKNLIYGIGGSPVRFHLAGSNLLRENVLLVVPSSEPFRYDATNPRLITRENNRQMPAQSPPTPTDLKTVAGAGIEPAFRDALLSGGEGR